ncbi:hypothetical protein ACFLQW_03185, partial [Candidatus Zixiibacteriota bacterium]
MQEEFKLYSIIHDNTEYRLGEAAFLAVSHLGLDNLVDLLGLIANILQRRPGYGKGKSEQALKEVILPTELEKRTPGEWIKAVQLLYDEKKIPGLLSRLVVLGLCAKNIELANELNKNNFLFDLREEVEWVLQSDYQGLLSSKGLKSWQKDPWALSSIVSEHRSPAKNQKIESKDKPPISHQLLKGYPSDKLIYLNVSQSVQSVIREVGLDNNVHNWDIIRALINHRPEYAAGRGKELINVERLPAGQLNPLRVIIKQIRDLFDVNAIPRLNGRIVISGILLIDPDISGQPALKDFKEALIKEIEANYDVQYESILSGI